VNFQEPSTSGRGTFARGVHPPERKDLSAAQPIEVLPTPAQVVLPVLQHIGAPAVMTAKPKQELALGDPIAGAAPGLSVPVHASLRGVAGRPAAVTLANGRHVQALPLKAQGEQLEGRALFDEVLGGDWPLSGLDTFDPQAIKERARAAGLVGQGGAAFPTYAKLAGREGKPVDVVLVNGCECEPYLTADHRLMLEAPRAVLCGALLAARATGATSVVVAVERNKRDAARLLEEHAAGTGVRVRVLKTKYPMGGERQTVRAALGRTVPTGGLPLDVGVVVLNVGTAASLARAVVRGKPLTHRVITVTGAGVVRPKNLLAPIGASVRALVEHCGGLTPDAAKVISGGPMMGFTLANLDTPITKGTSGITVLSRQDLERADETPCIRCGRCVDACPLHLVPTQLALAARHKDWDLARRYHLQACVECGCCAYLCPARLPLVQLIRVGKASLAKA
jgi:electron transport complex protein RnfC